MCFGMPLEGKGQTQLVNARFTRDHLHHILWYFRVLYILRWSVVAMKQDAVQTLAYVYTCIGENLSLYKYYEKYAHVYTGPAPSKNGWYGKIN